MSNPEASDAVLVLTRDRPLIDVLQRLAAAAGAELDVRGDLPGRSVWVATGLVFVGADLAPLVAEAMPRRPGVVLVGLSGVGSLEVADQGAIWRAAVDVGAERVALLPAEQDLVVEVLADALDAGHRCAVVGVVGGCGGAGASVLSAAIAVGGAVAAGAADLQDRRVLLADLDPLGGGIDLVLGAEEVPGLRWPDLAQARGRVGGGMLREALPRLGGLSVLSWGRDSRTGVPPQAATAVAAGAVRGFDLVVADLCRWREQAPAGWLRRMDLTLVVVPATVQGAAAAGRVVAALGPVVGDLRAVVRDPGPGRLPLGQVLDAVGAPLFDELRPEPGLAAALARGEPPGLRRRGPLARCAARVLDAVVDRQRAA